MKRIHRKLAAFAGAFVTICVIAFWLMGRNIDSWLSTKGVLIVLVSLVFAYLTALVRGGTTVRLAFRILAGFIALASIATSVLCAYLFFSSTRSNNADLIMAVTLALIGAAAAYAAYSGRSPVWLFRKRE